MFGKIIELRDNYIYLENKLGRAETNLIGYHVIFNDSNKTLVGEIENISIEKIEILLIGEIKNNMYKSLIIGSQYIKKIDSENISEEDIIKSNPYQGTIYENIEKIKYIVFKVKQFLKSSINKKCIWIKQKI